MPEAPSDLDQLVQQARRLAASVRPHHLAMIALATAVGFGVLAARTLALPGPQPILDGERMKIQVVAPVEPEVAPGSVMEVGDLVEGFEYRRPPPAMIEAADHGAREDAFEAPAPRPVSRRDDDDGRGYAPPPSDSPVEKPPEDRRDRRADRWFGFDAPQRDYRAEREARQARIEARMERERDRREVRWYRSDGQAVGEDERDVRPGAPVG
jgi:hypothetical protein